MERVHLPRRLQGLLPDRLRHVQVHGTGRDAPYRHHGQGELPRQEITGAIDRRAPSSEGALVSTVDFQPRKPATGSVVFRAARTRGTASGGLEEPQKTTTTLSVLYTIERSIFRELSMNGVVRDKAEYHK